jgi:PAS domain S-box-containing protein
VRLRLHSLAARVYGTTVVVLVAGFASHAFLQVRREERLYREMMAGSAEVMARTVTSSLAHDLLLADYAGIDDLLVQVVPLPAVLRLQVCEADGGVVSDVHREGGRARPAAQPDPRRLEVPPGSGVVTEEAAGGDTLVIWHPIMASRHLGWLKATLDRRPLRAIVQEQVSRAMALSALFITLCSGLLYLVLRRPVDGIRALASFARQLDHRKGETIAVPATGDEIEQLGGALNAASGELARSEQRLREERERLSVTLASLGEAVFATDLQVRLQLMNRAAEQLTGVPAAEAGGRPLGELFQSPAGEPDAGHRLQDMVRHPTAGREETLRISGPGGLARTVAAVAAPLLGPGAETLGAVLVVRDLTERERLAAERRSLEAQLLQSQKMEALGLLAGGVAHDFNNILTAIVGYANLALEDAPPGAPAREDLEQILAASDRAAALTRGLLAFGRKQAIEPVPVDLNVVVGELERILRRLVGEDTRLEVAPGPGPLVTVADPGQLGQVLVNLVANARDATPRGGRISLSTGRLEDPPPGAWSGRPAPPRAVWFQVEDTGAGIAAEALPSVFEPFFTTKPVGQGTGLGLAIVHGIVVQHGGGIELSSTVGVGTRFRILLPASDLPAGVAAERQRGAAPRGQGSILLVEDDRQVGQVLRRTLERAGYRVVLAEDGRQGQAALRAGAGTFDLLVSDVIMPELNGAELAEEARRLHPELPVLLMSGYTSDALERGGATLADVEVLHKPVSPQRLLARIEQLLRAGR